MANFVDGLIHGLIFVPARVLCGGSRTHIPTLFPPLVGYAKQPSLLGVIEGVEGLRTIAASAASISSRVTAVYTHVYFFVLYVWHTSKLLMYKNAYIVHTWSQIFVYEVFYTSFYTAAYIRIA